MAAVFDLAQYRRPQVPTGATSVLLTLHSHAWQDIKGQTHKEVLQITVHPEEIDSILDAIREAGGFWTPGRTPAEATYVPWPPAVVQLGPVQP